jgi:hypothetical protein
MDFLVNLNCLMRNKHAIVLALLFISCMKAVFVR